MGECLLFVKVWGKLPFDRSSPDISAHSLLAFELWQDALPKELRVKCRRSIHGIWVGCGRFSHRMVHGLLYGLETKMRRMSVLLFMVRRWRWNICRLPDPLARKLAENGLRYLLDSQNEDGGWGGAPKVASKITLTARALSALASYPESDLKSMERGFDYLYGMYQSGLLFRPEPIGLYFARLWYSEELYNHTFVLNALKKLKQRIK